MKPTEKARKCAAKKWRSRLLARAGDIFRWRKDGVSFRDIAARLKDGGLEVSHTAVASFVKARLPKIESPKPASILSPAPSLMPPSTKSAKLVLNTIVQTNRVEPEVPATPRKPFLDMSKIPEYLRPSTREDD